MYANAYIYINFIFLPGRPRDISQYAYGVGHYPNTRPQRAISNLWVRIKSLSLTLLIPVHDTKNVMPYRLTVNRDREKLYLNSVHGSYINPAYLVLGTSFYSLMRDSLECKIYLVINCSLHCDEYISDRQPHRDI